MSDHETTKQLEKHYREANDYSIELRTFLNHMEIRLKLLRRALDTTPDSTEKGKIFQHFDRLERDLHATMMVHHEWRASVIDSERKWRGESSM